MQPYKKTINDSYFDFSFSFAFLTQEYCNHNDYFLQSFKNENNALNSKRVEDSQAQQVALKNSLTNNGSLIKKNKM